MSEALANLKWTTRSIEALKVRVRTDFTDPETKGLNLRVTPQGSRTWALLYRRKGDSKKRRVTLGEFPQIGLSEARRLAEAKRVEIKSGQDPADKVAQLKKAETLGELLDRFLEKHPRPDAAWTKECKRIFNKDVRPLIGRIKLPDLQRSHIRQVVEAVRDRGATVTVNRTLAALRKALSWAVSTDIIVSNPALNLATDIEECSKDRSLSSEEIKRFWDGLEAASMGKKSRLALKLVLATGQRPGEVCSARKSEVDIAEGLWLIPAKRAKNNQDHVVPLSALATELFKDAMALAGESEFVFSSRPRTGRGIGLTTALQSHALSHSMRDDIEKLGLKDNPATPHDLRRTIATHMAHIGISDRIVGRVLNHGTELRRTITSRVYIRHDYLPEKRQALEAWAVELKRIVSGIETGSNVVTLSRSG